MTREDLVADVVALLEAQSGISAFELDEVPGDQTVDYYEVHLSTRGAGEARKLSGTTDRRGWRLQIRVVARTVTNAHRMLDEAYTALYRAEVGGTRIFDHLPGDAPAEDGEWYSALDEYTFAT